MVTLFLGVMGMCYVLRWFFVMVMDLLYNVS